MSRDLLDLEAGDYDELAREYAARRPAGVTAVVLTWNEEESIRGCLEALAADCDQVLLIDGGSKDATVDVARASCQTLALVSRPWTDDFAAQRNIAFDHVGDTGWLAYVDADETLATQDEGKLRAVLAALDHLLPDRDLVVSPCIVDSNSARHTDTRRIMRAATGLRFRGRLHERPYDVNGAAPTNVQVAVTLRHTGYEPDVIERRQKANRYARLVGLCLAEEPRNPKWHFYAVRDARVNVECSAERARADFSRLKASLALYERVGLCDYETERHTDTLVLLCDLALQHGGGHEIAELAEALRRRGQPVEAEYFTCFAEFATLVNRVSRLVDRLAATRAGHADRDLTGRSADLQAVMALSCGRYHEVAGLLAQADTLNSGQLTRSTLDRLAVVLPDLLPNQPR
jgi:hypothetical protein